MAKSNVSEVKPLKVSIVLDKERHLLYDLNAFSEMDEKFGSVGEALKSLEAGKISTLRAILWCGLLHEDENLTEKQVGAMIGLNDLERVTQALGLAITGAMPEGSKVAKVKEDSTNPNV